MTGQLGFAKRGMIITADYLRLLGADCEELGFFEAEWPQGAEVTVENCQRAVAIGLSLTWLAAHVFRLPAWERYIDLLGPRGEGRAEAFYNVWKLCEGSLR
jgi:hypothetical protein